MKRRAAGVVAAVLAALASGSGCAPALREPREVSELTPPRSGRDAATLVRLADAAWARRKDPEQASAAQDLYLEAAASDERRVDALLGAMKAMAFRIERERDGTARARLASEAVELGQWCQRRAPHEPACDYRLAIALGQQARERPSTGKDALGKMVELLRATRRARPDLDEAGPHRVLALVLLRAPGWPIGPGDPEAGLAEAREAVRRHPEAVVNQLALGEALEKNGSPEEAHSTYQRALELASREPPDSPDAEPWRTEARGGMGRTAGR